MHFRVAPLDSPDIYGIKILHVSFLALYLLKIRSFELAVFGISTTISYYVHVSLHALNTVYSLLLNHLFNIQTETSDA